jgi:hypothetical protein
LQSSFPNLENVSELPLLRSSSNLSCGEQKVLQSPYFPAFSRLNCSVSSRARRIPADLAVRCSLSRCQGSRSRATTAGGHRSRCGLNGWVSIVRVYHVGHEDTGCRSSRVVLSSSLFPVPWIIVNHEMVKDQRSPIFTRRAMRDFL